MRQGNYYSSKPVQAGCSVRLTANLCACISISVPRALSRQSPVLSRSATHRNRPAVRSSRLLPRAAAHHDARRDGLLGLQAGDGDAASRQQGQRVVVVERDGCRGDRREPGHRARARQAPRGAWPHGGAHRAGRRARGGRGRAAPRPRAGRRVPPPRRLRRGLRRRVRRVDPRRVRRRRHPGEQCCRIVQRDRHQLGGARRDGPQDQLLRGQDAHRSAAAALPAGAHHQPDPQHQLAAWPSQQGEKSVPEVPAAGRGPADGVRDRGHGVPVPGGGEGRDVVGARARVAAGVDGLRGVEAGTERLLPAAGAAAAGARAARQRQLLLPRVHAHRHDQGLGQAHR